MHCLCVMESIRREQSLLRLLQSRLSKYCSAHTQCCFRKAVCSYCLMSRGLLCTQFTPGSRAAAVLCQHSNSGIRPVHLFAPTSLAFNMESHTCSFHDDGKVVKKDCYTNKYKERKKIKKKRSLFNRDTEALTLTDLRERQTLWPPLGCWKHQNCSLRISAFLYRPFGCTFSCHCSQNQTHSTIESNHVTVFFDGWLLLKKAESV